MTARRDPQVVAKLDDILNNKSGDVPLHERFRALFTLKSLGDERSVDAIAKGFSDESALLKHELAYVLGQMKNAYALSTLAKVLADEEQDPMVRHEAAEAMGAIGHESSLPILEPFVSHPVKVIAETCELAVERIKYENSEAKKQELAAGESRATKSLYASVDPAPPAIGIEDTATLGSILLDPSRPLFERYRAMFALRNIGTEEAVLELAKGLKDDSALFRHEIAYVFGQLQHPASVPALVESLSETSEMGMVRHECAEALGSIATPDCLPVLRKFAQDPERVVRESCIVALDMFDYENSGELQYAKPLDEVTA
ncbi:ARM repeat-containing protein [Thamnocephalis sphaerospora]|uniref:Deoxyhypusine hydroxylase n=1 Tax=Thamnocephalis sphaerospora TaxID=78915 RepID=A0A4V1IWK4_9FUNG|nr:ARM repeat-containing protein [Thamnocephalis sphaerospora]|eukprot:RKP07869.1 ARM repeat-containing protein [Thamnocephalis sphaerospora]